jgi:hypothetical protein
MDAAIDAYLAAYGKPPRAAVRALLDPSDENVAALLAEQSRQELRAARVAARLTRLRERQSVSAASGDGVDQRDTPMSAADAGVQP